MKTQKAKQAKSGTMPDWGVYTVFAVIAVVFSVGYLFMMLYYTDGNMSVPLDDSYIYFQYARQIADGHFLQYNTGDRPTTGATSMLYALILSVGFLFGIKSAGIIIFVFVLNLLFLALSAVFIYKFMLKLLSDRTVAVLTSLLFLCNGPILWGYLSAMDIGLFSMMILVCMYFIVNINTKRNFILSIVIMALFAISRPEAFAIIAAMLVVLIVNKFLQRQDREYAKTNNRRLVSVFAGLVAYGLQAVLYYGLTGSFSSSGFQAKSVFSNLSYDYPRILLQLSSFFIDILKGAFSGFFQTYSNGTEAYGGYISAYFVPFAFLFLIIGLGSELSKAVREKKLNGYVIAFLFFVAGILATGLIDKSWAHYNRYQMPFYGLFCVGIGFGLEKIKLLTQDRIKDFHAGLGGLMVFISLFTVAIFGINYGRNCANIHYQQTEMAKWIVSQPNVVPAGAKIAINDAGALKFFGNSYNIDLIGLTSPGLTKYSVQGTGTLVEYLEKLPSGKRPEYFAIYPNWFAFGSTTLLSNEIYRTHLYVNTICGDYEKSLFLANWALANSGDFPKQKSVLANVSGLKLADSVDVADLESEERHNYSYSFYEKGLAPKTALNEFAYQDDPAVRVMDGGRFIAGSEKMRVRLAPGRPVKIVMRTSGKYFLNNLDVYVNGQSAGFWKQDGLSQSGDVWWDYEYDIPGNLVTGEENEIRVESVRKNNMYGYISYYYWFYQ